MTPKIDAVHRQLQRELIVAILRAYGVAVEDSMENIELLAVLEKALSGIVVEK